MATARESESQRQVRQMVNFIMQEANEKVNEIRIKVMFLWAVFHVFVFHVFSLFLRCLL